MINHVLLVGCGRMGSALLSTWQARHLFSHSGARVHVIDPTAMPREHVSTHASLNELAPSFKPEAVLFAIKPQQMNEVLPEYAARFGQGPLYLSIAAGKNTTTLSQLLGKKSRIIRAMPNTPALVGCGFTALFANTLATTHDRGVAEQLFAPTGRIAWIEDEAQMHAVTALSGSGPAYVFLFLEALAAAGRKAGLPDALADELAFATMLGSCALQEETGVHPAELREQVTSPGGTTAAALAVLMKEGGLKGLIDEAIAAAARRSKELESA